MHACRASCEANASAGAKVTVVSKAFEGKGGKRREKLVLQARAATLPTSQCIPCKHRGNGTDASPSL